MYEHRTRDREPGPVRLSVYEELARSRTRSFTDRTHYAEVTHAVPSYEAGRDFIGASPSGKAGAFEASIRWFESSRPSKVLS